MYSYAMVVRIPRWIPVPVIALDALDLYRYKRDFGITAAIVIAISLAAGGAVAATVFLSQTVQTAEALNILSAETTVALDTQRSVNAQLRGWLMIVNQRIDLVQEQIDVLWQIAQLRCEWKMQGLCVTSVPYENFIKAANLSRQLSSYLLGNWSREFDALMTQLRVAVVRVNLTQVDHLDCFSC